nr:unnamed protein product [Callosobruchus analis]
MAKTKSNNDKREQENREKVKLRVRKYRQALKYNPEKHEQVKRLERERYQRRKEQGKIKATDDLILGRAEKDRFKAREKRSRKNRRSKIQKLKEELKKEKAKKEKYKKRLYRNRYAGAGAGADRDSPISNAERMIEGQTLTTKVKQALRFGAVLSTQIKENV